jgi:hypothetical protein
MLPSYGQAIKSYKLNYPIRICLRMSSPGCDVLHICDSTVAEMQTGGILGLWMQIHSCLLVEDLLLTPFPVPTLASTWFLPSRCSTNTLKRCRRSLGVSEAPHTWMVPLAPKCLFALRAETLCSDHKPHLHFCLVGLTRVFGELGWEGSVRQRWGSRAYWSDKR